MPKTKTRTLLSTGEELDPRLLPRLGTRRNYDRATLGAEVGHVARLLGQPLLPHQQYAADVALEVGDDGELVYREVRLAWPRRGAKTHLTRSVVVHRCRVLAKRWGPQNAYYTAQSGLAARRKWEHDHVKAIDRSRYGPLGRTKPVVRGRYGRVKLDNNDPGIFWSNGSIYRPAPPTETAGHGDDADIAVIDEAFAHVDDRVEQAYGPAMLTRRSPQLWVVSAAGTDRSVYWYRKVLEGRRISETDAGSPVCYLEYSFGDDEDPFDPATWWRRIPTLGHTVTEEALAAELTKARGGDALDEDELDEGAGDVGLERFLRPYGGVWCRVPNLSAKRHRVISEAAWMANVDDTAEAKYETFGIHVTPDGATAAIGWCGWCGDRRMIGVFDHRPEAGTGWLVPTVAEIRRRNAAARFAVNPRSDAAPIVLELDAACGGELVRTSAAEFAAACMALKSGVDEQTLCYRRQRALEDALASAQKRNLAGTWAWEFPPGADGTPLVAVTLALHAHRTAKPRDSWQALVIGGR